jgi:TonB family protein
MTLFIGEALASRVETQNENELKSFYVVTHVVSDASPFNYEYVLDVKAQGTDVLVREIRIAPFSSGCPGVTVKAVDRVLTNATPKSVVKPDLCALRVRTIESVIAGAQPKGIVASIDDSASYSIVAMCGKTEKVFEIPYPETVEFEKLKRTNPQVASFWNLAHDLSRRAFGKDFSFYNTSASQDEAFQTLGAETVPSIKAGVYGRGFQNGSHLESLLNEYSGPVKEIEPWHVEFVGAVPADLLQYQLPKYPPLARQTRIEGEVRLVVVLDPQTGFTKEVNVSSGHPLLAGAAVAAVRDWHFQEPAPRKDQIEVAIRFTLRCTAD